MLPIQKKFVKYNFSSRNEKPKYIIIHDTGNNGGTALNHYNFFNGGNRGSSADFFVDSDNIIQIIDTDYYYSWAVGDGHGKYGITNGNSLSIELCLEKNGYYTSDTVNNALELTKFLMKKYNIPLSRVVRHYDASRKTCPQVMSYNDWQGWKEFRVKLEGTSIPTTTPVKPQENNGGNYMSKTYSNGSTSEPVYSDINLTNKIGSLNAWEKCSAIGDIEGKIIVEYATYNGNRKVGYVKYRGGL